MSFILFHDQVMKLCFFIRTWRLRWSAGSRRTWCWRPRRPRLWLNGATKGSKRSSKSGYQPFRVIELRRIDQEGFINILPRALRLHQPLSSCAGSRQWLNFFRRSPSVLLQLILFQSNSLLLRGSSLQPMISLDTSMSQSFRNISWLRPRPSLIFVCFDHHFAKQSPISVFL